MADIRERVAEDLALSEASKVAKQAAERILEKASGETALAAAIKEENAKLDAPDDVTLFRGQMQQFQSQGGAPPALALLFSMAQGTVKLLEAPANQGWILVELNTIEAQELPENSPGIQQARTQLSTELTREYERQLVQAMRDEVGVEINEDAVEGARKRLAGGS